MAALLIDHQVQDFAAWLPHYEAHAPARAAAGITTSIVWQAADDPNHVFVLMKGSDLAAMQELTRSEDLKQAMQAAGVTGVPNFHFLGEARKYPS